MAENILRTEVSKGRSLQPVLPCHALIQSCPSSGLRPVSYEQTGVQGGFGMTGSR